MSYSISYDSVGCPKTDKKLPLKQIGAVLLVLICVAAAVSVKETALPWIQQALLPGDPEVTATALENMIADLRGGDTLWNAVSAFCREIVENA